MENINDLFDDDDEQGGDAATSAPTSDYDGSVAEFREAARHLNIEALDALSVGDNRKTIRDIATSEIARREAPSAPTEAPAPPRADSNSEEAGAVDTAVRIRSIDWECECGNTNTHSLRRCGKCNSQRYQ